ncbi:MAG: dihydrolipoamide acetyltransferase family protein [Desulfobacterales bacterium]|jgi:pyruvate dehydrogenase E2 component (dihydrolipoamide acetyltransferase)
MARSFKLPDLGEGIHEGEVIAVLVAVGDQVQEGDPILEIETDKASVEIPSPFTGKVKKILVKAGDLVNVGDVLMTFGNGAGAEIEPEEKPEEPDAGIVSPPAGKDNEGPLPASPATRRLARELGVDLHHVTPTGPAGLVTADDVRMFTESATKIEDATDAEPPPASEAAPVSIASPTLPDFSKWGPIERIALRSVRRATAKRMATAWAQIPHVSSQDEVDVTRLEILRRRHKADIEAKGGKLTLTVFAVKAAAAALRKYPNFNVSLDTARGEIVRKSYYHVGVAADTEDGLIVPVIRNVDRKSIADIAIELNELVRRTRERKVSLEELQGSTFTITNIGAAGGRGHFAPIINYPEVAILGMSAARMKPVVIKNNPTGYKMVPRVMMPIVLAIDHRVLDGTDSTRFLTFFRKALEDPVNLLMAI